MGPQTSCLQLKFIQNNYCRRERRKRRQEAKSKFDQQAELIDEGVELLKEQQRQVEEDGGKDDSESEAQQTSFVKPTVEEIKQLQEQPKKLIDKKTE